MAQGRPQATSPSRPARQHVLAMLLLAAIALTACAPPPAPTKSVRGVLLEVRAASLQQLDTFTLRTDDGQELNFKAASDFNKGSTHVMSPGHMRQHMALAEHITVHYREESGTLVATSAEDTP